MRQPRLQGRQVLRLGLALGTNVTNVTNVNSMDHQCGLLVVVVRNKVHR